ncbi:MAG: fluoride efflux transporter CrcB [Oscillatoriales cyanobacterium RM2_1_1]|nr:fluoride efflux transporter CrcB [Oscillatoriales cyanobacterium SM2_3_0]NJO44727.1 fluoride efflux transporter CrcB [Oscillatoriales cyanobacterium RM2_1_1]
MAWIPVAISIGAVIGALSRYYITLFWIQKKGTRFPYGTFFVNLTGAFVIGFLSIFVVKVGFPVALQKLLITGFLGSYTTFSSYILDTTVLFKNRGKFLGYFYWLGSPVLGFLLVKLSLVMAQSVL